jgi:hypothetical protein
MLDLKLSKKMKLSKNMNRTVFVCFDLPHLVAPCYCKFLLIRAAPLSIIEYDLQ